MGIKIAGKSEFTFAVKANNDVHVTLAGEKSSANAIEIVLGGWKNTRSQIRCRHQGQAVASLNGQVLNTTQKNHFWVTWADEVVRVGKGDVVGQEELMRGECPEDRRIVNFVGVSTGMT